jgi:cell division septum initiation protein DivIVA
MISEVKIKLNEEKKELEQFIKELGKRITEKESVPSSSPNKTESKEEENNEKLRQLLKAWRNQLKEAEKQHQERPLIIEWEYVSSKTGKGIRELNEKILNVFQEKTGKYFPHISQGLPNGYWKVEQEVKSLKKRKKEQPFMKWKEFEKEINRAIENSISSKEIEEIVKWMHRCGVLLHFSELTSETTIGTTQITEDSNRMKEDSNSIEDHFDPESLVILEPQWLANVFKKVIDHKRRNEIDQDKNGILTDEKLGELWKVCFSVCSLRTLYLS